MSQVVTNSISLIYKTRVYSSKWWYFVAVVLAASSDHPRLYAHGCKLIFQNEKNQFKVSWLKRHLRPRSYPCSAKFLRNLDDLTLPEVSRLLLLSLNIRLLQKYWLYARSATEWHLPLNDSFSTGPIPMQSSTSCSQVFLTRRGKLVKKVDF